VCDANDLLSIRLFAAHLYHRALINIPSLIRSWLVACMDRNLSSTFTNYTSTYFSPQIISTQLAQIKDSDVAAELNVENLSIKVASNVNEVTAVYTVDEQQLEITLKIPSEWPLREIEIKDSKRVGVPENRWRGWLLGVRQIVSAQACLFLYLATEFMLNVYMKGGRIVDALNLFKKNVTLHFDGQVECAICYSFVAMLFVLTD